MSINSTSGPSKRKPGKLQLFPKVGDDMDVDTQKPVLPITPEDPAILHSLPIIKGTMAAQFSAGKC